MTKRVPPISRKIAAKDFADFCAPLIGLRVNHIWRGYGSAIFLELGKLRPTMRLDGKNGNSCGEATLAIEWSWRIEGARSILCGSWSDATLWPKTFAKLRGEKVVDVTLFGRLREIELILSSGVRVISFSTIEGHPRWMLRSSDSWLTADRGSLHLEKQKAVRRKK